MPSVRIYVGFGARGVVLVPVMRDRHRSPMARVMMTRAGACGHGPIRPVIALGVMTLGVMPLGLQGRDCLMRGMAARYMAGMIWAGMVGTGLGAGISVVALAMMVGLVMMLGWAGRGGASLFPMMNPVMGLYGMRFGRGSLLVMGAVVMNRRTALCHRRRRNKHGDHRRHNHLDPHCLQSLSAKH